MAIKIDIEKAYDLLEWNFIKNMFLGFGISNRWIDWIWQSVTTTTFKVIVNLIHKKV